MKVDNPIIKGLVIGISVISVVAYFVISGHSTREYPSIEQVENQITRIQSDIADIAQITDLPALSITWRSLETIASSYNVKVQPLNDSKDAGISESDLPGGQPWYGVLQGNTKDVSVAAIQIQQSLPILYGSAVLDNSVMGLGFALLGTTGATN